MGEKKYLPGSPEAIAQREGWKFRKRRQRAKTARPRAEVLAGAHRRYRFQPVWRTPLEVRDWLAARFRGSGLNLCCGSWMIPGFLNLDLAPLPDLQRRDRKRGQDRSGTSPLVGTVPDLRDGSLGPSRWDPGHVPNLQVGTILDEGHVQLVGTAPDRDTSRTGTDGRDLASRDRGREGPTTGALETHGTVTISLNPGLMEAPRRVEAEFRQGNVLDDLAALIGQERFDTVFCDPPFGWPEAYRHKLHEAVLMALKEDGILILNATWIPHHPGLEVLECWTWYREDCRNVNMVLVTVCRKRAWKKMETEPKKN